MWRTGWDWAATYLKVVRDASGKDMSLVLYLRPSGRFLFAGYYPWYERSVAAGHWSLEEDSVHLVGRGNLSLDAVPVGGGGHFERELSKGRESHTPHLTATEELEGWSLLSWVGPFFYVGNLIIDPDGVWLPSSEAAVDEWIERILA